MKKISLFLVFCLIVGVMLSCSKPETRDAGSTDTGLADSASGNAAVTKADIDALLDKINANYPSASSSLSSNTLKSQEQPLFMTAEKVKTLDTSNYSKHYEDLKAYETYTMSAIWDYCKTNLPEKCLMAHAFGDGYIPFNSINAVDYYAVLDPSLIPDDITSEELVLSLSWSYYEALYQTEYDTPHGNEMAELEERIGDIGLVYITNGIGSCLYDTGSDTVEEIDFFTDYREIKNKFISLSTGNFQEYIDSVMDEDAKIK